LRFWTLTFLTDRGMIQSSVTTEVQMPVSIADLGIDRMTRDERLSLIGQIWDSITAEVPPPLLSDAQRRELERRADEDDADPDGGIPWKDVKARARERFHK
jgi:putative addiction module component (TIGR02574 family)